MRTSKVVALLALAVSFALTSKAALAGELPATGTYFIINALNDQALEPLGGTPGQNVFLREFSKSGMQKWNIVRKIDPKTKQPTNRYTIKLAGDSTQLFLAPFPMPNHTSILDSSAHTYILQPLGDNLVVRCVERNGDSLCAVTVPELATEVQIQPKDDSTKFQWKFVKTEF
ncbi:MAG TPA: hypothetical protein V6C76_05865 [Drouetiella sp.]